jgi:hypothetical protein
MLKRLMPFFRKTKRHKMLPIMKKGKKIKIRAKKVAKRAL